MRSRPRQSAIPHRFGNACARDGFERTKAMGRRARRSQQRAVSRTACKRPRACAPCWTIRRFPHRSARSWLRDFHAAGIDAGQARTRRVAHRSVRARQRRQVRAGQCAARRRRIHGRRLARHDARCDATRMARSRRKRRASDRYAGHRRARWRNTRKARVRSGRRLAIWSSSSSTAT